MRLKVIRTGSNANCYLLFEDNHILVLDCGEKVSLQEVKCACVFNTMNIDAVLFTHGHSDHLAHVKDFMMMGIDMYGCKGLGDYVKVIPEKSIQFLRGGWKVDPWLVPHTNHDNTPTPCYAYYIQSPAGHRMVYMTDFFDSDVLFKSTKINTLLIACNHDSKETVGKEIENRDHVIWGHSSLSAVKKIIRLNQTDSLRNVVLCHMSRENATPLKMLNEIYGTANPNVRVFIARKGREINLDERR